MVYWVNREKVQLAEGTLFMNILVTGGAGYIGSVVTHHLLNEGYSVTVLDNLSKGYRQAVPDNAAFVQGDIGDTDVLGSLFSQGIEAIFHFASLIEAGESMKYPDAYFENNVRKSEILIDEAVRAKVNYFVFSSTAAVYQSSESPLMETDPILPANVYGETKHLVENKLEAVAARQPMKVCILRYFNAAGASLTDNPPLRGEAHLPESHLIPNVIKIALGQGNSCRLFGNDYPTKDGTCVRDYIHVDDLASAHLLALEAMIHNRFSFEICNLGNGSGFSNLEVIEAVRKTTSHPIPINVASRREGDAPILVANSDKAKQLLGWQPKYKDIETIIHSAWEWHRRYPDGFLEAI
jgi:UDP-glucose 4-epimerase